MMNEVNCEFSRMMMAEDKMDNLYMVWLSLDKRTMDA